MPDNAVLPAKNEGNATIDGGRFAGAVAGALLAGLALSVMAIKSERDSGDPSELARIGRVGAHRLGIATGADDRLPSTREQAAVQGAHLALSAAAGAAYALAVDEEADGITSGVGFGLAFYAAMHWVTGPLLRLTRPEWHADGATIGTHALNHVGFGLATAFGARLGRRREAD